jgi:hypothetical protein
LRGFIQGIAESQRAQFLMRSVRAKTALRWIKSVIETAGDRPLAQAEVGQLQELCAILQNGPAWESRQEQVFAFRAALDKSGVFQQRQISVVQPLLEDLDRLRTLWD